MKTLLRVALPIMILALVACSQKGFNTGLVIEPKPVPGIDFTPYKTWSFGRQGEYVKTGDAILDDPGFRQSVANHTTNEMTKLGYTYVTSAPDLLLMYHVIIQDRYDEVKANEAYNGYDMAWANVSSDDVWKEGSILLFVIDAKTGQQVWGSTATAEIDKQADFEKRKQRFNEVVTRMLADFPKHAQ